MPQWHLAKGSSEEGRTGMDSWTLAPVPATHKVSLSVCFKSLLNSSLGVVVDGPLCPGLPEWLISLVLSKRRPPPQKEDSHIWIIQSHDVNRKERMLCSIHQLLSPVWTNVTSICSAPLPLLLLLPQGASGANICIRYTLHQCQQRQAALWLPWGDIPATVNTRRLTAC